MRKLASVQRVLELYPIKGADFIETAQINGWQCIVRKGEFKVGDLGVYFEIDSVPPPEPVYDFLAPNGRSGSFRIRTKKLRGVISQGLLLPIEGDIANKVKQIPLEGDDWTELLGVTKYEVPVKEARLGRSVRPYGPFAADVPKTDEERLQSSPGVMSEMLGLPYVITEKCDGTSSTFAIDRDGVFRVYSRNWEIKPATDPGWLEAAYLGLVRWFALSVLFKVPRWRALANKIRIWVHKRSHRHETLYWDIARKYKIEEALRKHPTYALQGEIVGPGIQKNLMGLQEHELRAFNLFDKTDGQYFGQGPLDMFCEIFDIPKARVVERGQSFLHTQESLLKLAEAKYEGTKNEREGIVVRPLATRHSRVLGGRLTFKVISNKFLLAEKDEPDEPPQVPAPG